MGDLSRPLQESGRGTMDVTGSAWRTSSYSGSNGGACVAAGTWKAFTEQLKAAA